MKEKNIVITGGLGFIGSHIVDELIKDNKVIIIDNKSTGKVENLKYPNHENITLIEEDLNECDLNKTLNYVDYVFHLAAMASVPLSVDNPIKCNEQNVDTTVKLLDACRNNNVKKIIFSSSAAVYGNNENVPLKETEALNPTSPYAASKASCELYLKTFYDSYGLNYTILRYFNVFGPKQDKNSQYAAVIPNFISALLANISAAESDYNGIVNVASGEKITINKLYDVVKETLDSDVDAEHLPERKGDIKHSLADVSNIEKINYKIDFKNFENQLKETVKWFETQL